MTIFESKNYKEFLNKYIKSLPKRGRGQVNKIADALGTHPTLISQVLTDKRDLSLEQAQDLTEYMGLGALESDFFLLQVLHAKAGTKKLKENFQKKIDQAREQSLEIKNRIQTDKVLTDHERAIFYSSWTYSAIWIFCSLGDEGKSIEEICERFDLERAHVVDILKFLMEVDICRQQGSRYVVGAQQTHLEQGSPFLSRHYANWRLKAISRAENLDKKEMMFTAPFSISRTDFDKLREQFLEMVQNLYKTVGETNPQDIACVNIDLFWIK